MSEGFRVRTPRSLLVWGACGEEASLPELADEGPRLREQTSYAVFLRSTTDAPVALYHPDPVLLHGLRSSDGGRVVHGTVDFGGQVGRSTFEVRVGGETEREFTVEVFPTKLDYQRDYTRLVEETQEVLTGLVLEYLRSTFQYGVEAPVARPSRLEWLLLLRFVAGDLERALHQIARGPRRELARSAHPVRAERVRRPDAPLRRAVLRGAGAGDFRTLEGGVTVRERVEEHRPRPTLDTPEHRWLAARLREIRRCLAHLRREEDGAPPGGRSGGRRERVVGEIRTLEDRIARLERLPPLAAAGGDPPSGWASLPLGSAPGYREAHRACRILSLGLRLEGGPVRLAVRDLHLLYEQWCFLALVRLTAEATGHPPPAGQLLAAEQGGLRVRLRRGWEHTVSFPLADGGALALVYNPRFGADPLLVPQQPDVLLELRRPGSPPMRRVLDAKYRIDPSPEYRRRYGSPGPPEDALNGLHRYRDALRVEQAIALFPHRDAEADPFGGSRLWGSVERIGVGALPFLPGETGYVAEWLRGWIGTPASVPVVGGRLES